MRSVNPAQTVMSLRFSLIVALQETWYKNISSLDKIDKLTKLFYALLSGPEINQTCPVADSDSFGTCQHECDTTEDCGEGRLCCFNGCGRVCLEPVEQSCSYDDREVPVGESIVARDGCSTW